MAEQHGYTAERGPYAKRGDASGVVQAWYYGELATIKLTSDDRWNIIRHLESYIEIAKTNDSDKAVKLLVEQFQTVVQSPELCEALKSLASQLRDAAAREHKTEEIAEDITPTENDT